MNETEDKLIEERKKKLINLFKTNKWFAGYSITCAVAIVLIILNVVKLVDFPMVHSIILLAIGISACLLTYFNKGRNVIYLFLIWPIWIATYIRTRNLSGLRDVTTGGWTLGPDLDPFLFLRWAKQIIEHGSLMAVDSFRYVPLGYETKAELILLPYLMAWFHKIVFSLGITESITHSAVLFPVFMFAITVVVFFVFVREIFIENIGLKKASLVALLSSFFLSVIPALLPRTIAGIPEKESAAFLFLFLSLFLFLRAWKSESKYGRYILSLLAGLSTAGMALIWGGFIYIHLTIAISLFISLLLYQTDRNRVYISVIWFASSSIVMGLFSTRYGLAFLTKGTITGITEIVIVMMVVYLIMNNNKVRNYLENKKLSKVPLPILSIILTFLAGLVSAIIFFGPSFIADKALDVAKPLITPIKDRVGVTVAENRQPYFGEWANSFGPIIKGIPLFFWLFLIGSIYLYYNIFSNFRKKERIFMTLGYFIFLMSIIYSRYSPQSIFNGTNMASILFYLFGVLILIVSFGYYYYKHSKKNEIYQFKNIDFGLIILFSLFFFSIISARGGVRVIMVLVPPASIMASYFVVSLFAKTIDKPKESGKKFILWTITILVICIMIFAGYKFYIESKTTADYYTPSIYTQQWQKAMVWVRENTSDNAVFGHWWDYGYWVQSIGERATVLDGGNAIVYWDYFMGRYALTGNNSREAGEFLYVHNTTHFLIDSTDIGKYTAFSSIGSNKDYDRRSWISTFTRDDSQIYETKNATSYFYRGGFSLDEDIIYEENNTRIFLPGLNKGNPEENINLAGLGAIILTMDKEDKDGLSQPIGIFVYQNKQYSLPLRYAYQDGKLFDFGSGIEAGVFVFPKLDQSNGQISIVEDGALLYLSRRTVMSQLARLYLYGMEDEFFKTVHVEQDVVIENIKSQGYDIGEFIYYNGLRGPISIWEINYPEDIEFKEEYLETYWPDELRRV